MNELHFENIRPAPWRATYIFKPDLKALGMAISDYGWVSSVLVRREDSTIIDGHARWIVAQSNKDVLARDAGILPVTFVDCDEADAMIMHIRLNRIRGFVVAKPTSRLIKRVIASKKYSEEEVQSALGMSNDEFDLLIDGSLIKTKKLAEHKYSNAWIPVEAPPPEATIAGEIKIERPANADR
jgi:ParB-like chromosome segregation protein Spo0J